MFGDKGDTGVIELKQICDTKDKFLRGANTKISLQTVDVGNVSLRLVTVPVCMGGGKWLLWCYMLCFIPLISSLIVSVICPFTPKHFSIKT